MRVVSCSRVVRNIVKTLRPVALGVAVYLWCAWDFATFGRGTPLPLDPPQVLVARGLYRLVRNPMLRGRAAHHPGSGAMVPICSTLWYALAVALLFHLFVVLYEEPALQRRLGES